MKKIVFYLMLIFTCLTLVSCKTLVSTIQGINFTLSLDKKYYIVSGNRNISKSSITIPSKYDGKPVKEIKYYAFRDFKSLESVKIKEGITKIDISAFYGCYNLKKLEIPDSIEEIGSNVFVGCLRLKYNVYENASYLGNKTNPYLILVKTNSDDIKTCEINNKTKHILSTAFSNCKNLEQIIIPSFVKEISDLTLLGCDKLKTVYYEGTMSQWNLVNKKDDKPNKYDVYYYSNTSPTEEGYFWHYDENKKPVIW